MSYFYLLLDLKRELGDQAVSAVEERPDGTLSVAWGGFVRGIQFTTRDEAVKIADKIEKQTGSYVGVHITSKE